MSADKRRREIYSYAAHWPIYGLAASNKAGPEFSFRYAVGSFIEEYCNKVEIIQLDDDKGEIVQRGVFDHPYPATRIMWAPEAASREKDLLATAGDYLRLWQVYPDGDSKMECLLNNNRNTEYCAPLTSFDWNELDPSFVGACSIDTTCTIWDLNVRKVKTQLIAHDKEVYDIAWSPRQAEVFATVGADGSLRMFDLRNLEHSTIMFETTNTAGSVGGGGSTGGPAAAPAGNSGVPSLLRLSWNKQDTNFLATFSQDSSKTSILDVRMPAVAVCELGGHVTSTNGVSWAPHSSCHICTVGDDYQALIWDLSTLGTKPIEDPILAYTAEAEINNLVWSSALPDWVTIAFNNKMQILRV